MDAIPVEQLPTRNPFPLPEPTWRQFPFDHGRLERLTLAFLWLGLLARCVRYFMNFPLWEDECFLCANFVDRDFRGLLAPLNFHQVGPILFLWLELAVTRVLGYTEMTLRLVPFLASIGSLLLFYRLARICLTGVPRLLAVAVFSVTYAMIRYGAEAKPYGIDLLVSLVLIHCAINWLRRPEANGWLWVLSALTPLALGLSNGAVMIGGGLSLTLAWVIWRQRRWNSAKAWVIFNAALLGSFLFFYFLSIRAQTAAVLGPMREFWMAHFPPLGSLGQFSYWFVDAHAGDLLAYPAGGAPFQSSLSTLCWVAGLTALWRRRRGTFVVLCLAPQALTFGLALMKRYPYGGAVRLSLYLAPYMCLTIGYGAAALLAWVAQRGFNARRPLQVGLMLLALVGLVSIGRDLVTPYKNISDLRARAFAQWFWFNEEQAGEVACLTTDVGIVFCPQQLEDLNFSAEYLCNQRIYSPRHAARQPVRWQAVSASHPLRCVYYRPEALAFDEAAFEAWLNDMQRHYDLVDRVSYPTVRLGKRGDVRSVDAFEVFQFVPRTGTRPVSEQASWARVSTASEQEQSSAGQRPNHSSN